MDFGSLVATDDRPILGRFWESSELRRTPVSSTVASAEVGVAQISGSRPTYSPTMQKGFDGMGWQLLAAMQAAIGADRLGGVQRRYWWRRFKEFKAQSRLCCLSILKLFNGHLLNEEDDGLY